MITLPAKNIKTSQGTSRRLIHLTGGLAAGTNPSGKLVIHPMGTPSVKVPVVELNVTNQRQYVGLFRSLKLDMIGFEDLHDDKGFLQSLWHALDPKTKSVQTDLDYIWGGISNALRVQNDSEGELLARNVLFGLRASAYRLRDISQEYLNQNTVALCNAYDSGIRFKNLDTIDVFLALHSFLVEMGTLRDYIATFLARKRFGFSDVSSMNTLRKKSKSLTEDPIALEISLICDKQSPNGWMSHFSLLRDQIVHASPISSNVTSPGVTTGRVNIGETELPVVHLYIAPPGLGGEVDSLVHCLSLFRKMMDFLREVAIQSGIIPEPLTFSSVIK